MLIKVYTKLSFLRENSIKMQQSFSWFLLVKERIFSWSRCSKISNIGPILSGNFFFELYYIYIRKWTNTPSSLLVKFAPLTLWEAWLYRYSDTTYIRNIWWHRCRVYCSLLRNPFVDLGYSCHQILLVSQVIGQNGYRIRYFETLSDQPEKKLFVTLNRN